MSVNRIEDGRLEQGKNKQLKKACVGLGRVSREAQTLKVLVSRLFGNETTGGEKHAVLCKRKGRVEIFR